MHDEHERDDPAHRSNVPRPHRKPEDARADPQQHHPDDREDVMARLLDFLRLVGDHQQRHLRAGIPAAEAPRPFDRGRLAGLTGRGDVAVHRVVTVALLAYADDLTGNAHRVQPPEGQLLRSEEHTSELQSRLHLVCRLLLEKKKYRQHPQCLPDFLYFLFDKYAVDTGRVFIKYRSQTTPSLSAAHVRYYDRLSHYDHKHGAA